MNWVVSWYLRGLNAVLCFHFDLLLDPEASLCSFCVFIVMAFTQSVLDVSTQVKRIRVSGDACIAVLTCALACAFA